MNRKHLFSITALLLLIACCQNSKGRMRLFFICLFVCGLPAVYSFSQTKNYDLLKKQGKLTGKETRIRNTKSITPQFKQSNTASAPLSSCQCWQPVDATWQVAQFDCSGVSGGPGAPPDYRNDDWSTCSINIPFTFCFYGTNYTSLFINNNGNISFGAPYSTFTATPFPDPDFIMVAPFWGDVDSRDSASGLVYYKITPAYMIVQWDTVGYFSFHSDKRSTFQLIISNGTDPIIPNGNNVSFCYKDMQWTTGDASLGVNGFGGEPATVGVNKGDGINYVQFGRFDMPGAVYDGPFGNADGIDWLDNKSFFINTCSSSNIPPIANGLSYCDTITLCSGDSLNFNILFQSPESGQTTTVTATTTLSGFTIVNNTPGNNVQFDAQLIGQLADVGYNNISFSATDDGSPVQTTTIDLVIHILASPVANAGTDTSVCAGPVQLNATGGTTYSWSPSTGLSNPNIPSPIANPAFTTSYIVTVSNGVCIDKDTIVVFSDPLITTGGSSSICIGNSITLTSTGGVNYSWQPGGQTTQSITDSPTINTTYTVTVTNACGSTDTAVYAVTVNSNPIPNITGATFICYGSNATLTASGGTSYSWSTGATTASITVTPLTTTTYTVTVTNSSGCTATATHTVTVDSAISLSTSITQSTCGNSDGTATATASGGSGGFTYSWNPSSQTTPTATALSANTYTVIVTDVNGCSKIASAQVTNSNVPGVSLLSQTNVGCYGDSSGIATVTASGGTGVYTYNWLPSGGTNATATGLTANTYTVTVTSSTCTASTFVFITQPLPLNATVFNTNVNCNGAATATATASVSGGTTMYSYLWNPSSQTTVTATALGANTYTVTITDAVGCTLSKTFNITQPLPVTSSTSVIPCVSGLPNGTATVTTIGGTPGYTYLWTTTPAQTNDTAIGLAPGTYTVFVNDNNNCADTAQAVIDLCTPDSIFIPNVFTPNGDGNNDIFYFPNAGYKTLHCEIYNRWGTKIYQWDGVKGGWDGRSLSGRMESDGVYYYIMKAEKLSGEEVQNNGFLQLLSNK